MPRDGGAFATFGRACLLSVALWLLAAAVYSRWLTFSDYTRFYAGLTQLLSALIFFQVTAMIVILGAEFNRALSVAKQARKLEPS